MGCVGGIGLHCTAYCMLNYARLCSVYCIIAMRFHVASGSICNSDSAVRFQTQLVSPTLSP